MEKKSSLIVLLLFSFMLSHCIFYGRKLENYKFKLSNNLLLWCSINSHFSPSSSIHNSLWFSLLLTCFIISSDCGCSIGKYLFEWIFSIVRRKHRIRVLRKFFEKKNEMTFNESMIFFFILFPKRERHAGERVKRAHLINEWKTFWSRVWLAFWVKTTSPQFSYFLHTNFNIFLWD